MRDAPDKAEALQGSGNQLF